MDYGYDEIIMDNIFYQTLLNDYRDLFLKCVTEDCILCVPRSGTVSKYSLTFQDFCSHILLPNVELPESHFVNVNGEEIRINNHIITVNHGVGVQSTIHILFEETFYTKDELKYKVLCIEKPIEGNSKSDATERVASLRTLKECIDFLWLESGSPDIAEKISQLTSEFLKENNIDNSNFQLIKEITHSLYVKCVQTVLKCQKIRERVDSRKYMMANIKVAVETYMQHQIYNKIIKGISTNTAYEDAHLNKIVRNMSKIQIQDMDIRKELYDVVPKAKFELSKIDSYSTVLGKSGCLKKMFRAMSNCSNSNDVTIGADDVLQLLIFLILKIGLPNWCAQLKYLKHFRFSAVPEVHDDINFLITSFEAAIEHIQSNMFAIASTETNKTEKDSYYNQLQPFHYAALDKPSPLQTFFNAVSLGNTDQVKMIMSGEKDIGNDILKLCHPLCICSNCKNLTSRLGDSFPTVNSCDSQGLTPLHIAAMYGRSTMVDFLLSNGADPNKSDVDGLCAMHFSAMNGDQNGILLLAYAGAEVNVVDYTLNTPLHYCSNNGHENCVKALVYFCENSGTKLSVNAKNSRGDTPLHNASTWGYLNIVQILLENGADPTVRNKRKLSPIDVAHNMKVTETLTLPLGKIQNYVRIIPFRPMLDHSEEISREPLNNSTVRGVLPNSCEDHKRMEKTLKAISVGDVNLACFYLGLDSYETNESGVTCDDGTRYIIESEEKVKCHPLCRCSNCENFISGDSEEECFPFAAKGHPLDINSCNAEGFTPLHVAAQHGRKILCDILIRNGAALNVQTEIDMETPLILACKQERLQVVQLLLRSGCGIDLQDRDGCTALHHACRTRNTKLVKILMDHEPNLNLKNKENKTALQIAEENMYIGVIRAVKGQNSLCGIEGLLQPVDEFH